MGIMKCSERYYAYKTYFVKAGFELSVSKRPQLVLDFKNFFTLVPVNMNRPFLSILKLMKIYLQLKHRF